MIDLDDPEPWPTPVHASELLSELAATFRRYVSLPPLVPETIALWVLHTHAFDAADTAPSLVLSSPEKRCGKTRTLSLIGKLVTRPIAAANITSAALFRTIESMKPTLLMDEVETFLWGHDELRGVLNSGHTRETAFVVRTVGEDHEPRQFSTWAPKAMALIGKLPDTLADRSIVVPMQRRAPQDQIDPLRLDRTPKLLELRRQAIRWAADNAPKLRAIDPRVPDTLNDRAADNWRPLLAIATAAGPEWLDLAKKAAAALSGGPDPQDGSREQLLADIRAIFNDRGAVRIFSAELIDDLLVREDRPWNEWRHGRPMTAVQLAKILKPFGIHPRSVRLGTETGKGYELAAFTDAFSRYLSSDPSHSSQIKPDGPLNELSTRHAADAVTANRSGAKPSGDDVVTGVTGPKGEPGWEDVE